MLLLFYAFASEKYPRWKLKNNRFQDGTGTVVTQLFNALVIRL